MESGEGDSNATSPVATPAARNGDSSQDSEPPEPKSGPADDRQVRKDNPPPPLTRDKRGWHVAPAPDGRGAPEGQSQGQGNQRPVHHLWWFWVVLLLLLLLNWGTLLGSQSGSLPRVTVPFSPYFLSQVKAGKVQSISSTGNTIQGTFKSKLRYPSNDKKATATNLFATEVPTFWNNNQLAQLLQTHKVQVNAQSTSSSTPVWEEVLLGFGPTILLIGLFWFLLTRARSGAGGGLGALGNFGRSQARRVDPEKITVSFDDVAGIDEAKSELTEIVDFLKNPGRYTRLGRGSRAACCCTARPAPARRCWPEPSPARRAQPSSKLPHPNSSRG